MVSQRRSCWVITFATAVALSALAGGGAFAQTVEEILSAVVRVRTVVPGDARTAATLGREREGTGTIIDAGGLILTVGYLILEASGVEIVAADGRTRPAAVVGHDPETGIGLLRALDPPRVRPLPLGSSAAVKERDPVLVASFGGPGGAGPAFIVSKRTFAGGWEYLLDEAIFTAPAHPTWSGAALIGADGKLVGVGSLLVRDAAGMSQPLVGNMFIPIDVVKPLLADLIAEGRSSAPGRPWLGMTTDETNGRLSVLRVSPGGPAEGAGVVPGDIIETVGGQTPANLIDFYRKLRAQGDAGAPIALTLSQGGRTRTLTVKSVDRRDYLRLRSTY